MVQEAFPGNGDPGFFGPLAGRMEQMRLRFATEKELVLTGSSFGGLMATIYALERPERTKKVILLAPALNFSDFTDYSARQTDVLCSLYIGSRDLVCPPDIVVPLAERVFTNLAVHVTDDDHLLRDTFARIDWQALLNV